jgi:hypothetical protein
LKDGFGVIIYNNNRIYEGQWKNDVRNGKGMEIFSNGNQYIGEYNEGKAHG